MRNGYILCAIVYNEAHLLAAIEGLPPDSIATTDWSVFPRLKEQPNFLDDATYFLLRIPGDSKGLYRALEEMMDVAGVYREGYEGLKNHRRLLDAVGKIQRGTSDRAVVDFWLSPERLRQLEMEYFQSEEDSYWRGYRMCLEDPGCAKHARTTFANRSC
jgi:hypothetical protein